MGKHYAHGAEADAYPEDRRVDRDVFFIELHGGDHHSKTKENLSEMLKKLNSLLDKFQKEVEGMGLWDQVTLVSTSDFGRTLVPNTGSGCGQIHGQYPSDITAKGKLNIGRGCGCMIPTLIWESVWNGVLEWMGLEGTELDKAMPNRLDTGARLFMEADVYVPGPPTAPVTALPTSSSSARPMPSPVSPTSAPTPGPTSAPVPITSTPTPGPTSSSMSAPMPGPTLAPMSMQLTDEALINVALGKSTAQSSTTFFPMGMSDKAVDGNTNGHWGYGSVTYTNSPGWWQVDLGEMHYIRSVKVYNQNDCCKANLNAINVLIFDENFHIAGMTTLTGNSPDILEWVLDTPVNGRHVQIQNPLVLHVAEVEVMAAVPVANLALGKSTTQSATPLSPMGTSDKAVDGNMEGHWGLGSVIHTNAPGWWQVDLGSTSEIYAVKVYNRQDCCKEQLNGINVLIFDENFQIVKMTTLTGNSPDMLEWALAIPVNGRHVQIQNPLVLHVAEVKVLGLPLLPNLALGKPTSQRITPYAPWGTSDKAVDGNTDGMWGGGSVTHGGGSDWWQVDLGDTHSIHSVKVYNRLDCCKERMNVLSFFIFDAAWALVKAHTIASNSPDVVEWVLDEPLDGQRVQLQNANILHMAEVEVYGI